MDVKIVNALKNELALQSRVAFSFFTSNFIDRLKSETFDITGILYSAKFYCDSIFKQIVIILLFTI